MTTRKQRKTEPAQSLVFRRQLRVAATKSEQLFWSVLRKRNRGVKFRRQHTLGPYIVDFVCLSEKLVVEIDGLYHDYTIEEDIERQKYIESLGYVVLRFANEDVLNDLEAVERGIANRLSQKPTPSP